MPRKKNTAIWENYFHSATSKTVKCKHCEKVYQFGNVNKMTRHLLKCYKCPTVIKNKIQKIHVTSTAAGNLSLCDESHEMPQDNSLTDTASIIMTSSEISTEKKLYLDQLLSKAIFVTGSPLSIVEHPLWVQFFDELQPLYNLPSREAITTTYLETIYNKMVNDPLGYPIKEERPSTPCGNIQEIKFCNINNIFHDHDSSDSD